MQCHKEATQPREHSPGEQEIRIWDALGICISGNRQKNLLGTVKGVIKTQQAWAEGPAVDGRDEHPCEKEAQEWVWHTRAQRNLWNGDRHTRGKTWPDGFNASFSARTSGGVDAREQYCWQRRRRVRSERGGTKPGQWPRAASWTPPHAKALKTLAGAPSRSQTLCAQHKPETAKDTNRLSPSTANMGWALQNRCLGNFADTLDRAGMRDTGSTWTGWH